MTEFQPGGRRRIDRVLAPDFLEGLAEASLPEVRGRRAEANQEEVDLSFARRLIQGRVDLLRAEQERRRGVGPLVGAPHTDAAIAEALKKILADDERNNHGISRHLGVEPTRVGEHRREAERAVADVTASDHAAMTDAELAGAIAYLEDVEARLSRARRQVQAVVDTLTEEVARRYQTGAVSVVQATERLDRGVGVEPA
jgi:hypothetical protein